MGIDSVHGGGSQKPETLMRLMEERTKQAERMQAVRPEGQQASERPQNAADPKDYYVDAEKAQLDPKGIYQLQPADGRMEIKYLDPKNQARQAPDAASAPETAPKSEPRPVPERADEPKAAKAPKAAPPEEDKPEKEQKTVMDTGNVDREIRRLKARKQQLEQQARSAAPEDADEAARKLAEAERELTMKDNDSYRRAHASVHTEG